MAEHSTAEDPGVYVFAGDHQMFLLIRGRVTANEAYALFQHAGQTLDDPEIHAIWVDMDRCNYIDSTTIGTLIRMQKRVQARGGKFLIANPSPAVAAIIEKTKLTQYFSIVNDPAVASAERDLVAKVPVAQKHLLESSFVLDAHNDIVDAVPELRPQFEALLNALAADLQRKRQSST